MNTKNLVAQIILKDGRKTYKQIGQMIDRQYGPFIVLDPYTDLGKLYASQQLHGKASDSLVVSLYEERERDKRKPAEPGDIDFDDDIPF